MLLLVCLSIETRSEIDSQDLATSREMYESLPEFRNQAKKVEPIQEWENYRVFQFGRIYYGIEGEGEIEFVANNFAREEGWLVFTGSALLVRKEKKPFLVSEKSITRLNLKSFAYEISPAKIFKRTTIGIPMQKNQPSK